MAEAGSPYPKAHTICKTNFHISAKLYLIKNHFKPDNFGNWQNFNKATQSFNSAFIFVSKQNSRKQNT